jgi:hypothetical protein
MFGWYIVVHHFLTPFVFLILIGCHRFSIHRKIGEEVSFTTKWLNWGVKKK